MKKIVSLLLAGLLTVGLLAGCSGDGDSTPTTKADQTTAATTKAPDVDPDPTDTPKEIPTITWIQIGGGEPANLAEAVEIMNEYTAEKIGVKIDLKFFSWGDWEKGTNNMLNTGEYFDIMFTNTRHFTGHALQGKFMDIGPLLDTVPDLKAFMPEALWKAVTIRDSIYSVPTYKDSAMTQYFAYDKALVEKYDIDITAVKSLQDLDAVLRIIKAGEEAETGETMYPLPLHKEGISAVLDTYFANNVRFDDASGKVENIYERDEVVKDLELIHKWFEDGLINPDASTLEEAPKYRAVFVVQAFAGAEVNLTADRGYDIVIEPYSKTVYSTDSIQGSLNAISANSNYPEESLKYLELINTDNYLRNLFAYGVPDKEWKDNGDGTITKLTDTWNAPAYSQATFFEMSPVAPNSPEQWTMVQAQNKSAIAHVILGFTLDDTNISTEFLNVNNIITARRPELLTGAYQGSTADYLKAMNDEMFAAGLQTVLDETQAQVNTFLGK